MAYRDSVDYVAQDRISQLARTYWLSIPQFQYDHAKPQLDSQEFRPLQPAVVEQIYQEELLTSGFSHRRCVALELCQYLEQWLWPHFDATKSSRAHVLSICAIVNEKARGRVPIWQTFVTDPDKFSGLIQRVLHLLLDDSKLILSRILGKSRPDSQHAVEQRKCILEQIVLVIFLSHCFTNLAEVGVLRRCLRELYSLAVWKDHLQPTRLTMELNNHPRYAKLLKKLQKYQETKISADERDRLGFYHSFVPLFVDVFLSLLESIPEKDGEVKLEPLLVHYLERCVLLLVDLESMLLTRRILNVVLDDRHVVVRCQYAPLNRRPEGKLFSELVEMLTFYAQFQIDESTGDALDDAEMDKRHCANLNALQLRSFSLFRDKLLSFAVSHPAGIETSQQLRKHLQSLDEPELEQLASSFGLVIGRDAMTSVQDQNGCAKRPRLEDASQSTDEPKIEPDEEDFKLESLRQSLQMKLYDKELLIRILVHRFARRQSELEMINSLSLYPTEELIWDENRVPTEFYSGEGCLALPKLGLQFLTLQDYLLRNFNLFRLESTYEIRQDIEDAIVRLKPWRGELGQAIFDGWSRMALPIQSFTIVEVAKPDLGSKHPARVRADLRVALAGLRNEVRNEWLGLRRHDPVFLVTIRPSKEQNWKYNPKEPFIPQVGLHYVRGCEIEGQVDKEGKLIPDEERLGFVPGKGEKVNLVDTLPTWRVRLDPAQYQLDMERLKAEQKRGDVIRAKVTRAKREGRSAEEIAQLEAQALEADKASPEDVYDTFNIIIRRKPKENNFKAVLETIRDLMNTRSVVPDWLLDLLMGYLDPAAAHYRRRPESYETRQNWFDTFLNSNHLKQALPQYKIQFADRRQSRKWQPNSEALDPNVNPPPPPYRLTFPPLNEDPTAKIEATIPSDGIQPASTDIPSKPDSQDDDTVPDQPLVLAEAYDSPLHPPWHLLVKAGGHLPSTVSLGQFKPGNQVPFTPSQLEAIRSGMQSGLTLVVGPPGTGKTDVAVQIIHNLYHNYPNQRILIVTHSNQALNQLFEKIIALDVDERHLLRLGHGEEGLDTDKDFSRYGRVDYILAKRIKLLQEVMRLARTFNPSVPTQPEKPLTDEQTPNQPDAQEPILDLTDQANFHLHTCETAQYFYIQDVLSRWEDFICKVASSAPHLIESGSDQIPTSEQAQNSIYDPSLIRDNFPFMEFFTGHRDPPKEIVNQLFKGNSFLEDMAMARACFQHLHSIFTQLDEFRAFELMRTGTERANYLLIQEAKIIAMTCTHAALRRRDLVQLGFTYDTILMEEAAQILEIETFIPLLLQNPDISGRNRLKRWIMIGDHHQLPPVVKNQAFNNYSNMGQSLFARLVKLGVPTVQLDAQGRARPSLSRLYSWRYKNLQDLPHTINQAQFRLANPGFRYDVQLINVEDYKGVGESEPSPYFYQNLAEAEYIVAVYMYMRILGYPAEKITILTTYNGQKHLIRDVIAARCAKNPLLGSPSKVTTVDRFQGQQNDYVLVSLVRTRTVGHLRDVRRLVVALSRARLGLYIFARIDQFASCPELKPAFDLLLDRSPTGCLRPVQLHLTPWETWMDPRGPVAASTLRMQTDYITQPPLIIRDMPHMSSYVRQLYDEKLESLMAKLQATKKTIVPSSTNPKSTKQQQSATASDTTTATAQHDAPTDTIPQPVNHHDSTDEKQTHVPMDTESDKVDAPQSDQAEPETSSADAPMADAAPKMDESASD